MIQHKHERAPRRLLDSPDPMGEILHRTMCEPEQPTADDVQRHWSRLEPWFHRKPPARPRPLGLAVATVLTLTVLTLFFHSTNRLSMGSRSSIGAVSATPAGSSSAAPAPLVVSDLQTRELDDGTVLRVSAGGRARVLSPSDKFVRIELQRGEVDLTVPPRKAGEVLEVSAGRLQFRVLGTRFRVAYTTTGLSLSVTEGRVAILENDLPLRTVSAGESWSRALEADAGVAPAAVELLSPIQTPPVQTSPQADCLEAARRGRLDAALACFAQQAKGHGGVAELALFEMARIQHEALGRADQAFETLRSYRERFPNGTLRTEVSLKFVQLCVELHKYDLALEESGQLLRSGQPESRQAELRFLRGKLYERRGNYAQAANEYALAAVSKSAQSDRARLQRASCLDKLGRTDEARSIYTELQRSEHPNVREEARNRLADSNPKGSR